MSPSSVVGVVVGRFQVADLHPGHQALIEYVASRHQDILIVLGSPASYPTPRNPLPYPLRASMIKKRYPTVQLAELTDCRSNQDWSKRLDQLIAKRFPTQTAILYGSRDSFRESYQGHFPTESFPALEGHAGTALRSCRPDPSCCSADFRNGMIHAQVMRAPLTYPAVDVAILDQDGNQVLLAGKNSDGGPLRFIGGFVEPTDSSYEQAARREALEETDGIGLSSLRPLGSARIDDWRYRNSSDGIISTLFLGYHLGGQPQPTDDVDRLKWVPLGQLPDCLVPEHRPLGRLLLANLSKE